MAPWTPWAIWTPCSFACWNLIGWSPLPFQILNSNQSKCCKYGLLIIKLSNTPVWVVTADSKESSNQPLKHTKPSTHFVRCHCSWAKCKCSWHYRTYVLKYGRNLLIFHCFTFFMVSITLCFRMRFQHEFSGRKHRSYLFFFCQNDFNQKRNGNM